MKTKIVYRTLSAFLLVVGLFVTLFFVSDSILTANGISQENEDAVPTVQKNESSSSSENSLYFKYYKILKARSKMHKV